MLNSKKMGHILIMLMTLHSFSTIHSGFLNSYKENPSSVNTSELTWWEKIKQAIQKRIDDFVWKPVNRFLKNLQTTRYLSSRGARSKLFSKPLSSLPARPLLLKDVPPSTPTNVPISNPTFDNNKEKQLLYTQQEIEKIQQEIDRLTLEIKNLKDEIDKILPDLASTMLEANKLITKANLIKRGNYETPLPADLDEQVKSYKSRFADLQTNLDDLTNKLTDKEIELTDKEVELSQKTFSNNTKKKKNKTQLLKENQKAYTIKIATLKKNDKQKKLKNQ